MYAISQGTFYYRRPPAREEGNLLWGAIHDATWCEYKLWSCSNRWLGVPNSNLIFTFLIYIWNRLSYTNETHKPTLSTTCWTIQHLIRAYHFEWTKLNSKCHQLVLLLITNRTCSISVRLKKKQFPPFLNRNANILSDLQYSFDKMTDHLSGLIWQKSFESRCWLWALR